MRAAAALLSALVIFTGAVGMARAAPTVSMSGDEVTENLVADLAFFYRHHVHNPAQFELAGGGTAGGISDVARGVSEGGLVSRPLSPSDPPGLHLTTLALSGICLVSNLGNPIANLTHDELQGMVAGQITDWSQIPGSRLTDPIVPIGLLPTAGAAYLFQSAFVDFDTALVWQPIALEAETQVRDYLEHTTAGFGYIDLALARPLHVIDYNGIACSRQTVENGTYPARATLGVVTRGPPRGALARFLHWVHTSPVAQRVIATHYAPV